MTNAPATLSALVEHLTEVSEDTPVSFRAGRTPIGAGYHITELKLADIHAIDCGGKQRRWQEVQLQLLDGEGRVEMAAGKMATILARSADAIPGLGEGQLSVEFAPGNNGLRRYLLGIPAMEGDKLSVPLIEDRASCKPMAEAMARAPANKVSAGCCG